MIRPSERPCVVQVYGDSHLPHLLQSGQECAGQVDAAGPEKASCFGIAVLQFLASEALLLCRGDLLEALVMLDEEEDVNKILKYFSYEHFYVIYCKVRCHHLRGCAWR